MGTTFDAVEARAGRQAFTMVMRTTGKLLPDR